MCSASPILYLDRSAEIHPWRCVDWIVVVIKCSEYVRLNVIHKHDIATPARVPSRQVDRKLYHH